MRLSKQDQRNYAILAAFLVVAGYFLYSQFRTPFDPAAFDCAACIGSTDSSSGRLVWFQWNGQSQTNHPT